MNKLKLTESKTKLMEINMDTTMWSINIYNTINKRDFILKLHWSPTHKATEIIK